MEDLQQIARGLTACLCSFEMLQPLKWLVPALGCEEVTLDGRKYRTIKQVKSAPARCETSPGRPVFRLFKRSYSWVRVDIPLSTLCGSFLRPNVQTPLLSCMP